METYNQKGYSMKAVYVKRRVFVALFILISGIFGFRIVNTVAEWLARPTFTCQATEVALGHQTIWSIADQYCSGHVTDAASQIMKDNHIKSKDLRILLPTTIIVIKGGK